MLDDPALPGFGGGTPVPEQLMDDHQRHAGAEEQGGRRVPELVETDGPHRFRPELHPTARAAEERAVLVLLDVAAALLPPDVTGDAGRVQPERASEPLVTCPPSLGHS
jgi:hypothetical protein